MRKYSLTYNIYQPDGGDVQYTYVRHAVIEAWNLQRAIEMESERQKKYGVEIDIIKAEII